MPNMDTLNNKIAQRARSEVRAMCAQSPAFLSLKPEEQYETYKQLCEARAAELRLATALEEPGLSQAMAEKKASDLIDDRRFEASGLDKAGQRMADLVDTVDFPGFVRDLLKAVFDANINVILQQTEEYMKLLKTATKSLAEYVRKIDDAGAFAYLAENSGDEFSFDFDEKAKDPKTGQPQAVLLDKAGNKLDLGDNEVKARIMDAKLAMAKEQRALLRESILMGVTRLVVKRGLVKASVLFDVKSTSAVDKTDKASMRESFSTGGGGKVGGGLWGALVGGISAGASHSQKRSQISVSTAKGSTTDSVQGTLAGSVEIEFMTDFFKLDNFAAMYGPEAGQAGAPGGTGAPKKA
jgi:hypothetical protein